MSLRSDNDDKNKNMVRIFRTHAFDYQISHHKILSTGSQQAGNTEWSGKLIACLFDKRKRNDCYAG